MKHIWVRILLALLVTLSAAIYQRKTGPTYPYDGERKIGNTTIDYKLLRSHGGSGDQPVEITVDDPAISGMIIFRRYKVAEPWHGMTMTRVDNKLVGTLPHQPPAGKLEYFVVVNKENELYSIPTDRTLVTRFKGDVPDWALMPHILLMFVAMLMSTLTGFEALVNGEKMYRLTLWTAGLLLVGGMIFGPIVQKFAFGEYWTGIPFGIDLTDNKTLIAMIFWLIPVFKGGHKNPSREWIIVAALVLLVVFSIPHSFLGSELNYDTGVIDQGN